MRTVLEKDERMVTEVKRHWLVLSRPIFFCMFAVILFYSTYKYPEIASWRGMTSLGLFLTPVYFLYKFYEREVDIWAVTNRRVVDEWGVFTRNTKESPLDMINNVSYTQPFVGMMLGYGNVTIQTAAEQGGTEVSYVTNPKELKDAITNQARSVTINEPSVSVKDDTDEMDCPYCAERIKKKAKLCRFCKSTIVQKKSKEVQQHA